MRRWRCAKPVVAENDHATEKHSEIGTIAAIGPLGNPPGRNTSG
jgi:hypothetical protein